VVCLAGFAAVDSWDMTASFDHAEDLIQIIFCRTLLVKSKNKNESPRHGRHRGAGPPGAG
jgi:hypothetical protein